MLTKKSGTSLLGIRSGAVWIIIYNYFIIIFFYRIVLSSLCVPYILPQTIMRIFLYNTPMTNSTTPEERTTCTFWYVSFYILNPLQKVNLKSKKVIIFYHFALFWSHDHVNYCIKHIQCLNFKSNAEAILKVIKKILHSAICTLMLYSITSSRTNQMRITWKMYMSVLLATRHGISTIVLSTLELIIANLENLDRKRGYKRGGEHKKCNLHFLSDTNAILWEYQDT